MFLTLLVAVSTVSVPTEVLSQCSGGGLNYCTRSVLRVANRWSLAPGQQFDLITHSPISDQGLALFNSSYEVCSPNEFMKGHSCMVVTGNGDDCSDDNSECAYIIRCNANTAIESGPVQLIVSIVQSEMDKRRSDNSLCYASLLVDWNGKLQSGYFHYSDRYGIPLQ